MREGGEAHTHTPLPAVAHREMMCGEKRDRGDVSDSVWIYWAEMPFPVLTTCIFSCNTGGTSFVL
jgi:hypothetical protein